MQVGEYYSISGRSTRYIPFIRDKEASLKYQAEEILKNPAILNDRIEVLTKEIINQVKTKQCSLMLSFLINQGNDRDGLSKKMELADFAMPADPVTIGSCLSEIKLIIAQKEALKKEDAIFNLKKLLEEQAIIQGRRSDYCLAASLPEERDLPSGPGLWLTREKKIERTKQLIYHFKDDDVDLLQYINQLRESAGLAPTSYESGAKAGAGSGVPGHSPSRVEGGALVPRLDLAGAGIEGGSFISSSGGSSV